MVDDPTIVVGLYTMYEHLHIGDSIYSTCEIVYDIVKPSYFLVHLVFNFVFAVSF